MGCTHRFWGFALIALSAALVGVPSRAQAGACSQEWVYEPTLRVPPGGVPSGGGVLFWPVELVRPIDAEGFPDGLPTLSARQGEAERTLRREPLAPGWFVVHMDGEPGELVLRAGSNEHALTLLAASDGPAPTLSAPEGARVTFSPSRELEGPMGTERIPPVNVLNLGAEPPSWAVGVLVVRAGTSIGFGLPTRPDGAGEASRTYSLSTYAGRCRSARPGSVLEAGMRAEVFFVDAFGRRSEAATVEVGGGPSGSEGSPPNGGAPAGSSSTADSMAVRAGVSLTVLAFLIMVATVRRRR